MEELVISRTRYAVFASIVAGVLAAGAGPASAQGLTGSIDGTVRDQTGAVMPGVTITVTGPSLIGGPQVRVTEADGSFRFPVLPPGAYQVELRA